MLEIWEGMMFHLKVPVPSPWGLWRRKWLREKVRTYSHEGIPESGIVCPRSIGMEPNDRTNKTNKQKTTTKFIHTE